MASLRALGSSTPGGCCRLSNPMEGKLEFISSTKPMSFKILRGQVDAGHLCDSKVGSGQILRGNNTWNRTPNTECSPVVPTCSRWGCKSTFSYTDVCSYSLVWLLNLNPPTSTDWPDRSGSGDVHWHCGELRKSIRNTISEFRNSFLQNTMSSSSLPVS